VRENTSSPGSQYTPAHKITHRTPRIAPQPPYRTPPPTCTLLHLPHPRPSSPPHPPTHPPTSGSQRAHRRMVAPALPNHEIIPPATPNIAPNPYLPQRPQYARIPFPTPTSRSFPFQATSELIDALLLLHCQIMNSYLRGGDLGGRAAIRQATRSPPPPPLPSRLRQPASSLTRFCYFTAKS
jgi:hypothetical protein